MVQKYIKIHSDDLVAVALCPLEQGTVCNVDGQEVTLIEDIAQGHKFDVYFLGHHPFENIHMDV